MSMLKRKKEDYDILMIKLEKEIHAHTCMIMYMKIRYTVLVQMYSVLLILGHITSGPKKNTN